MVSNSRTMDMEDPLSLESSARSLASLNTNQLEDYGNLPKCPIYQKASSLRELTETRPKVMTERSRLLCCNSGVHNIDSDKKTYSKLGEYPGMPGLLPDCCQIGRLLN